MRTKSLRPTKIEVSEECSDEKERIVSYFNRTITWSMLILTKMRPTPTQRDSGAKKPMLRKSISMISQKQLEENS